jgi:hypothetical protein
MPSKPLMYKRLIKEIPKHKSAKDALLASGFSESTANGNAKRAISSAIKHQAKEILETQGNLDGSTKQLMSELVGLSRDELFATILKIAKNDKDYGSALKILAPLAKEHGVILSNDEQDKSTLPPALHLSFGPRPDIIDGNNMAKNIEDDEQHTDDNSQEQ